MWKMGTVDEPGSAVTTIVKEQIAWQKQRMERRKPEYPNIGKYKVPFVM